MKPTLLSLKNIKYLLIIPIAIILFQSYLRLHSYFDDVLIYARYIENFLNGNGLVYNIGEKFNGLTSPFFAYLSILLSYITRDVILSLNLLSTLFFILSVIIFYKIAELYNASVIYVLVSCLFAYIPLPYSSYGMETMLFIFLIGLSTLLFLKNNYKYLFTVLALLILTRSEGVFLILPLLVEHFRLRRKFPKLSFFIIPLAILCIHYTFNYIYFGSLTPHSAQAKLKHAASGFWSDRAGIIMEIIKLHHFGRIYSIIFFSILIFGIYKLKLSSINRIFVPFILFTLCFYIGLKIPFYHWYFIPLYFIFYFYFAIGLHYLSAKKKMFFQLIPVAIVMLFFVKTNYYLQYINSNEQKNKNQDRSADYVLIGKWLNKNTSQNSSVGMVEIGIVGYFSQRKIVDFCGLVSPKNADFIEKKDVNSWIKFYNPDYVLIHNPIWPYESVVKENFFLKKYRLEKKFSFNKKYSLYKKCNQAKFSQLHRSCQ